MKYFFFITTLLFVQPLFAQQKELNGFAIEPLLQRYNEELIHDVNLVRFIPYSGLGKAELSFQHFKGGLKPIQESENRNDYRFESYGAKKIKRFTLAGGFVYSRELADSLRWNHKSFLNEGSPYYFGSRAGTNYDKISYELNAIANYQVSDRISLGMGTNYHVGANYSSNDPRAKLEPFKLSLEGNVNVHVAGNNYLNGLLKWGYGYNDITIDYKNKVYYESLLYPEFITYLNYGLGYVTPQSKPSQRRMIQELNYKGFGLGYTVNAEHIFWNIQGRYEKREEHARFGTRTSLEDNATIGHFDVDKYELKGLVKMQQHLLFSFYANHERGEDRNGYFNGVNNFVNEFNQAGLSVVKTLRNKHSITAVFDYADAYSADGSAATSLNNAYIRGGVAYQKTFRVKENDFAIGMSANYKKPLYSEINYSVNNINAFINDVVFNDYYFNDLDILRVGIQAQSILKVKGFLPFKLSANVYRSDTFSSNQFNTFGAKLSNWGFGASLAILVR